MGSKMLVLCTILAAPFFLWLFLYAISRYWSLNLRPLIVWIRIARWTLWGIAAGLVLLALVKDGSTRYGAGFFACSIGLSFPERWLKAHFAPELVENELHSAAEWWPRKPEV
jgi:hypothetical protein